MEIKLMKSNRSACERREAFWLASVYFPYMVIQLMLGGQTVKAPRRERSCAHPVRWAVSEGEI